MGGNAFLWSKEALSDDGVTCVMDDESVFRSSLFVHLFMAVFAVLTLLAQAQGTWAWDG